MTAGEPPLAAGGSAAPGPARHLLFDLDDTLYPASTGFFRLVAQRIRRYMESTLALDEEAARALQRRYWKDHGTSLRGLMLHHGVEPLPFLDYVHDVPVETLLPSDPALRRVLEALPGPRHVFTNAYEPYVRRVLSSLGIEDLFERVFDITAFDYVPKPDARPYEHVMAALGVPGERCVLVDDTPGNLVPARARGWLTVWLRSPVSWAGGSPGASLEEGDRGVEADVVIESLAELPAALAARARPAPPAETAGRSALRRGASPGPGPASAGAR